MRASTSDDYEVVNTADADAANLKRANPEMFPPFMIEMDERT